MENTYPYIKGKKIIINGKFIGDKEIAISLAHIQQFMCLLGINNNLDEIKLYIKEDNNSRSAFLIKEIDKLINKIKPFEG